MYIYVKKYKHYRTGKIMLAKDYGLEAWKFYVKDRK